MEKPFLCVCVCMWYVCGHEHGGEANSQVLSYIELVQGQLVHEGAYQVVCGEVEDQAKRYGDGERGQCLLKDGQQQEGQTQALGGGRQRNG